MKKFIAIMLVALAAFSAFAGGSSEQSATVSTDGSTSMEKVILSLAEQYMIDNPGVNVTYNPTGSGTGITAALEGRCDIGLSSRALKDSEVESGLKQTIVALDGIAIIVNADNSISDLSIQQIADLFTGKIANWSEIGGPDAPVVAIGREAGSGTRDGFESITGTEDACTYSQELTSTGAVITAVSQNPGAIGYASLASNLDQVKAVTVEGVVATEDTVKSGEYKIQRPFVFATKSDAPLSDAAQTGSTLSFGRACVADHASAGLGRCLRGHIGSAGCAG